MPNYLCYTGLGDFALRLVNGRHAGEGTVEVFYNGQWGSIYDYAWTYQDAMVVCQQLGFEEGLAYSRSYFGTSGRSTVIYNVQCTGNEVSLKDCPKTEYQRYLSMYEAGVQCYNDSGNITVYKFIIV